MNKSKGIIILGALESERDYLKHEMAVMKDADILTKEYGLRLNIRHGGYELILECIESEIKKYKRLLELEEKVKNNELTNIEKIELLSMLLAD